MPEQTADGYSEVDYIVKVFCCKEFKGGEKVAFNGKAAAIKVKTLLIA